MRGANFSHQKTLTQSRYTFVYIQFDLFLKDMSGSRRKSNINNIKVKNKSKNELINIFKARNANKEYNDLTAILTYQMILQKEHKLNI
jgi:hypothetical protein